MTKKKKSKGPHFIMPPNTLKKKAGDGGIPAHLLFRAQKAIDTNTENFKPYAHDLLTRLTLLVDRAQGAAKPPATTELTALIMQLKANGAMFRYNLISMVADVILRFLEHAPVLDKDVLDIVRMHNNILTVILNKEFTGDGGKQGERLTAELSRACGRYYKKFGIKI